ncbi:MAG: hypothetical protein H8D67_14765 [Deltaproteobacteria bacterium]|nr:hypothetical protein [Deltaproteobacteria bacterium]
MEEIGQGKSPLLQLIEGRMSEMGLTGHGKSKALAGMAETSEAVISRLLNGSKAISVNNIYKVLSALNLIYNDSEKPQERADFHWQKHGKKLQEENHKLLKELNQQLKEIINLKDQIENLKEEIQVLKQEDLPPPMLSMGICTPGEKRKTNAK